METGEIFMVLVSLALFGIGYNALVSRLETNGMGRGFTALLVVGGVLVTLIGAAALIGIERTLWVLACFAASGTPMVIGAWERFARQRQADERAARQLAKEMLSDDEKTSGWVRLQAGDRAGEAGEQPGQGGGAADGRGATGATADSAVGSEDGQRTG
jgi:hypothetical protein